jgi:hypothetical protein
VLRHRDKFVKGNPGLVVPEGTLMFCRHLLPKTPDPKTGLGDQMTSLTIVNFTPYSSFLSNSVCKIYKISEFVTSESRTQLNTGPIGHIYDYLTRILFLHVYYDGLRLWHNTLNLGTPIHVSVSVSYITPFTFRLKFNTFRFHLIYFACYKYWSGNIKLACSVKC